MDNLTPTLTDTQLRANIDALQKGGMTNDKVQAYVDNYAKGTDGSYVLKTQTPAAAKPLIGSAGQSLKPGSTTGDAALNSLSNTVGSIFPGQKIGQAIGTLGGYVYEKAKGLVGGQDNSKYYDLSAPTPLQVGGDAAQAALTIAAPGVGRGGTALGRIAANTALGAGLGGTNAIAQGEGAKDVVKSAAIGGVVGGGASALTEGVSALTKNLPNWLTKAALPKLENKNVPYALENTRVGSLTTLQARSKASLQNYEGQIQGILSHPEYKASIGGSNAILGDAIRQFPNSEYTVNDLVKNAHNIAPEVSGLITKFEKGTADVAEINLIRKSLDQATKSVYTSINRPPEAKLLGAALSNAMRGFVQRTAPETEPIFGNYAKEIGLNKALNVAVKKGESHIKLRDIAAGSAGFYHNGFQGALEAIIAERLLSNPTAQLGAAKLLQEGSKVSAPAANAVFRGLKAPLMKKATNSN